MTTTTRPAYDGADTRPTDPAGGVADMPVPFDVVVPVGDPAGVASAGTQPTRGRRQLGRRRWAQQYAAALFVADLGAVLLATALGYILRFGTDRGRDNQETYFLVGIAIVAIWMVTLIGESAYEIRHMTTGAEEFKRVLRGTAWALGIVGLGCYLLGVDVARGFVFVVFPFGVVLLLALRYGMRQLVSSMRRDGLWTYRLIAVGRREAVEDLLRVAGRSETSGLRFVGACVPEMTVGEEIAPGVAVLGSVFDAAAAAARIDADAVAVAGAALGSGGTRQLGWELEGTGRGLIMAPSLTEVAGPRVHVSPVEGLPLMWVEQPQFSGLARVVKRAMDVAASLGVLALISPLLVVTAIAIKATSHGPVFFRQSRLGQDGEEFLVWKFRSMSVDAEARRADLMDRNEQDGGGVLFKIAADPRITPVGRWIRKLSIDELPQLFNVLAGQMSLVGPRPFATVDSTYEGPARRRLLVRPGMTGLWQISGRSDTTWEDAVRYDLYYVENWSLALDVSIILRTVWTVLKRQGAY